MATETENQNPQASETEEDGIPTILASGPDGKVVSRPMTPEEMDHASKADLREAHRVEEANEVLSLLDPVEEVHVVSGEVTVGNKKLTFNFKILSFTECATLEAKKYRRGKNSQIIRDVQHEETNSTAWLLHMCVVRDENAGKQDEQGNALKPSWVPMFTLSQIRERIMANGDPKATELLYGLTAQAWSVNPTTNPLLQAQALQEMTG